MVIVTKTSPFTGNAHTLEIPCSPEQYYAWIKGEGLIQQIMPDVPAELREFLITGVTPEEWDKYIGSEVDEIHEDDETPRDVPILGRVMQEATQAENNGETLIQAIDREIERLRNGGSR